AFDHYPDLPRWSRAGCDFTLLAGTWGAHRAPTRLYSPLVGLDLYSASGARLKPTLEPGFEYGVMVLEGAVSIDGQTCAADELAYLGSGRDDCALTLSPAAGAILVGGEPFPRDVHMWWNFVAHERAHIVQAQRDWESGDPRFGDVPGF